MAAEAASSAPERVYAYVEAWGMAAGTHARVLRPRTVDEIRAALRIAREAGVTLGLRGTGNSYGDASMNSGGFTLDVSRMNRILSFDEETGVAEVEPGVTINQLWRHILPLGFWPRVVSGTSFPTIAGAAAMNIHGKNNFAVGTIGDAIQQFDIVLPSGELRTCDRAQNTDLFHAAIGGFGMLGVFSRIVLKTKRVYSGDLEVLAFANHDLGEMMDWMDARTGEADYLVGWVDCFAKGDNLGRGQVHYARYLEPGEDPHPEETLTLEHQMLPTSVFGYPKAEMWRILRLLFNDPGMRLVNFGKYMAGRLEAMGPPQRWRHAEFAFLLDFMPNWKWGYGREPGHGLIQHQTFLPKETAREAYIEILRKNQEAGHVPYLGVFKRHRPDPFWLTHAVDGWSFAMDFRVTPKLRASLWEHCARLTDLVVDAGGKFYFAKDLVLRRGDGARMFAEENLRRFMTLKRELDPEALLQTDLWRRVFGSTDEADWQPEASA